MSETDFTSEMERAYHTRWKASEEIIGRLLRDKDSLQQEVQRLRELMRVRQLREERSSAGGIYGPAAAGSF